MNSSSKVAARRSHKKNKNRKQGCSHFQVRIVINRIKKRTYFVTFSNTKTLVSKRVTLTSAAAWSTLDDTANRSRRAAPGSNSISAAWGRVVVGWAHRLRVSANKHLNLGLCFHSVSGGARSARWPVCCVQKRYEVLINASEFSLGGLAPQNTSTNYAQKKKKKNPKPFSHPLPTTTLAHHANEHHQCKHFGLFGVRRGSTRQLLLGVGENIPERFFFCVVAADVLSLRYAQKNSGEWELYASC